MRATIALPKKQIGLCAALALAAGLVASGADAQNSNIPEYSYKRPSPTTITTFQSLFDTCTANSGTQMSGSEHSLCVGYFDGIIDFYLSVTPLSQRQFCLPTNPPLTREQGRDKLVQWSETNPQAARQPAAVGVYEFLVANFPCSGKGG